MGDPARVVSKASMRPHIMMFGAKRACTDSGSLSLELICPDTRTSPSTNAPSPNSLAHASP
eukprot:1060640-Rhodomonas_salina.1